MVLLVVSTRRGLAHPVTGLYLLSGHCVMLYGALGFKQMLKVEYLVLVLELGRKNSFGVLGRIQEVLDKEIANGKIKQLERQLVISRNNKGIVLWQL